MPSRRSGVPKGLKPFLPYLSKPGTPMFWVALIIVVIIIWQAFRAQEETKDAPPPTESGNLVLVERVVDGDTLVIEGGARVRLIGVDTPETKHPSKPVEPLGPEASEFTRLLVEGKTVRLDYDRNRQDKYGRVLGYVYVDGTFLNEELIRQGLSKAETQYSFSKLMKDRFLAAEQEARDNRRGLWSLGN